MPAASKASIEQAYLKAAQALNISGWEDDDKVDAKRLVKDHLSSNSAERSLLVFDNANDIGMWVEKSAGESDRLFNYLPKSPHGSVIFTTRDKKTAVRLAVWSTVEMSAMDEADSEKLLRNYLIDAENLLDIRENAATLLARLMYVKAAAYINANGINCLGDYLSLLEVQEEDTIDLLSKDFQGEGRYPDVKSAVATTWLISFERIGQSGPLAADIVSLMSLFRKLGESPSVAFVPTITESKAEEAKVAEEAEDADHETKTVYSDTESLRDPKMLEYVTAFVDILCGSLPSSFDTTEFDKVLPIFDELLRAFALKVSFDGSTYEHRNLMYLIHRYRR
ncbi:hypothetical protein SBRCBS47491_009353 [Sporothrix bragantina]|uniref:NB-ARC domain-containing protein n=1 Tax=Sporothrix bragantina TaxID=671064 RepID=A0ABP0CXE0_9PEZI